MDLISRSSSTQVLAKSPSLQTHLTCATSSQRLRGSASITHLAESQLGSKQDQQSSAISSPQNENIVRTMPVYLKSSWIFRAGCLYAIGSGLFLAWHIFLSALLIAGGEATTPSVFVESPLESWSTQQRLSVLSTIQPQPTALEPFVIKSGDNPVGPTICFWIEESELPNIPEIARRWGGPISLLVKTRNPPSSAPYKKLLRSLTSSTLVNWPYLSVHVLSTDATPSNHSPNAYLNLARIFSVTSTVLVYPGNTSSLYNVFDQSSDMTNIQHHHDKSISNRRPVIPIVLGPPDDVKYPFRPLAPILLSQDHPLWCTERAFIFPTRESDWDQCLWQLWMESYGEIHHMAIHFWSSSTTFEPNLIAAKLRRRFSAKFRSESCVLATNRLNSMASPDSELQGKRAWLKKFCDEVRI